MPDDSVHPPQPTLDQLDVRLETTPKQGRDEISIGEVEASELMRIEETLAYAREVAKQAASSRRPLDGDGDAPPVS